MTLEDLAMLSRRDRFRVALVLVALIAAIVWATVQFMKPAPPRHIALASGAEFGLYNRYAQRYKEILARDGVTVEVRMTQGAAERGGDKALDALRDGDVDAVVLVGGAQTPLIMQAMLDPRFELMNLERADGYPRRFAYITKLLLPKGTMDFEVDLPREDVNMVGTQAMLAARADLHPALIDLLLDAAREIHAGQGYFEKAGEFPNVVRIHLPVSTEADRHMRFGPSFLHRYLPFWIATVVERTIVVVVPLILILVPFFRYLPELLRWRVRSRVFRWYGELALLERDIATRHGPLPIEQWQQSLDRIDRAARSIRTPARQASEVYTLREHVALVRKTALARAASTREIK
jgi:hypothetical protein